MQNQWISNEFLLNYNLMDLDIRKIAIFCNLQIFNLLNYDEKYIVLLAQDYIDSKVSLEFLNDEAQRLSDQGRFLILHSSFDAKYRFSKLMIACFCGYCEASQYDLKISRLRRIMNGVRHIKRVHTNDDLSYMTENQIEFIRTNCEK